MHYDTMGALAREYLNEIEATHVRPAGHFHGGAVLELADNHYLAIVHPDVAGRIGEDEARSNCLGFLQDMGMADWGIADEVTLGSGRDELTVLHLHPAL